MNTIAVAFCTQFAFCTQCQYEDSDLGTSLSLL